MGNRDFHGIVLVLSILFCFAESYVTNQVTFPGYKVTESRDDLFCPESSLNCLTCCICNALPCWKINASACGVSVTKLHVEYTDPLGAALLVDMDKMNNSVLTLNHTNGRLRRVPENACDFAVSLVEIDLRNNNLDDISGVKCLKVLQTLRLDYNSITEIPDGIFSDMNNLIYLSLSHNKLVDLQAFAIKLNKGNIINVDFSHNSFRKVDVTNILRPGEFCEISFEGSEIEDQTNTEGYTIKKDEFHGPGRLNFHSSSGQTWLNFSSLGIGHYSNFGSYMEFVIDWDNTSIHCDCNIVPFLRDLGTTASQYWPNLGDTFGVDFICAAPEHMKGVSLTKLYKDASYDDLVCNLEDCPTGCACIDKQSTNVISVKCKNLEALPNHMPIGFWGNFKLELEILGESLSELSNRDYLSRVVRLNLTETVVSNLDYDAINNLRDAKLILPNVEAVHLPETFFNLNPENIKFGLTTVFCDCSNLWIGEWITGKSPSNDLKCSTERGIMEAKFVTADFLNCPEPDSPLPILVIIWCLTGATVMLSIMSTCIYLVRYELILLKRRFTFERNKEALKNNEFDVFLSFTEETEEICRWVWNYLLPSLSKDRYKCFVPCRDILPGDSRDKATEDAIRDSRNFLVVLSADYKTDVYSAYEFDTLWKNFYTDKSKQLIVINYEHLNTSEINDRRLKAVIRIRDDLNFKERDTKFLNRLDRRLGILGQNENPPDRSRSFDNIEMETPYQKTRPIQRRRNISHQAARTRSFDNIDLETFDIQPTERTRPIQRRGEMGPSQILTVAEVHPGLDG